MKFTVNGGERTTVLQADEINGDLAGGEVKGAFAPPCTSATVMLNRCSLCSISTPEPLRTAR